jgi:cytochrome b561
MITRAAPANKALPAWRYTRTAIVLHWTIAVLIMANLAVGYICGNFELASEDVLMNLHKVAGILVFVLSHLRLGWRLAHRPPPLDFGSDWQRCAAGLVQGLLYGLMIALPLTGWIVTSSFPKRHPISLGFVDVPFLPVTTSLPRAMLAHSAHEVLAIMMTVLVAGHVAAALHHQFVLRDNLITRVLPRRWPENHAPSVQ